ncbi:MAG: GlcG/HbpS family heme-binding protein [Qingshengfaniella sp.]
MKQMLETLRKTAQSGVVAIGATLLAHESVAQDVPTSGQETVQGPQVNIVPELSFAAAQRLTAQGVAQAQDNDMRLALAVVDRAGNLLSSARMDGAGIVTVDVAIGKARTAAFLKSPSKRFEDMINAGSPSMVTVPGILPLQGGMPVLHDGEVIGAVGVSGSSGDNDQAIAAAIASSFRG